MLVGFLLVFVVTQANCAPELTRAGCKTCSPDGQTCTACTNDSHNVQVDGKSCDANCPEHSAANGQKVCECEGGYGPVTGENRCEPSNTNKSSGLSTGAIAGIAVAAVIVVGGLVGFLCWWFLCRGKA
ncbi:VSP [Giardia duodenalis]|uniref:VSP n=1 Tax=Giardia intestinalis (strain ATCC 50803 / WB clone C6) TaxID=184922 RepID=A8BB29_GIAIC|nr:VSP [Giardia intestinalis]KAE8302093.1 VSP [Giardia intestinalis]|eukprot:XP_001708197.1 VSP [Giardia lamblia ATCC 50803]